MVERVARLARMIRRRLCGRLPATVIVSSERPSCRRALGAAQPRPRTGAPFVRNQAWTCPSRAAAMQRQPRAATAPKAISKILPNDLTEEASTPFTRAGRVE